MQPANETESKTQKIHNINPIPQLDPRQLLDEENLPHYNQEDYYPAHIGQVFNTQYKIIGKLGYGVFSTVWLCRDITPNPQHRYIAPKISKHRKIHHWKSRHEFHTYQHLKTVRSSHPGRAYIRELYSTFEVYGPHGTHQCLVQPVMHMTVADIFRTTGPMDLWIVKAVTRSLFGGLDFLHSDAGVIHTGILSAMLRTIVEKLMNDIKINANNLMIALKDESVLESFEKSESENPLHERDLTMIELSTHPAKLSPAWKGNTETRCCVIWARLE